MNVLRCPCSAPATHQLAVQVVPLGSRPDQVVPEVQEGYFSAAHVPTLANIRRQYERGGLAVIDYEITELIS